MSERTPGSEFSHVVQVDRIGPEGVLLQLTASPTEREALAERFGILSISMLGANVRVVPDPVLAGHYLLKGQLDAEVEQTCVVSLEPVRQRISEAFLRRFAPADALDQRAKAEEDEAEWLDPEAEDPPDPLESGGIDVGEVVAEALSLALDPYPRKPGAELPANYRPDADSDGKVSPFAALAKLKAAKKD